MPVLKSIRLFLAAKKPILWFHAFTSTGLETVPPLKRSLTNLSTVSHFCGLKLFCEKNRRWPSCCSVPLRTNDWVFVGKTPDSKVQERKMVLQKWTIHVNYFELLSCKFFVFCAAQAVGFLCAWSTQANTLSTAANVPYSRQLVSTWARRTGNKWLLLYIPSSQMVPASLEEQWLTFFSASIKFPVESEAVVDKIQLKQCFCLTRNIKELGLGGQETSFSSCILILNFLF